MRIRFEPRDVLDILKWVEGDKEYYTEPSRDIVLQFIYYIRKQARLSIGFSSVRNEYTFWRDQVYRKAGER